MKLHSILVLVIIIDVMLSTCTPPTSVVKVMRFNFSYSYYALVGGAIGHTVVCSFVCVCVCEHGPPVVLAEYVSVSILCGIYGRSVSVVVNT